MRQTGQATTAIGNFITNMQVHAQFFAQNKDITLIKLFLGDDSIAVMSEKPNTKDLREYIKIAFNMESKDNWYNDYGTFCQMVLYKGTNGSLGIGPDYIRLKFRYEVTNGVHDATNETM